MWELNHQPSSNNFTPLTFKPSLPTYIDTFHLSSVSFTLLIVAVLSFLVKTPLYSSYSFISRRRTPLQFFLLHATQFRLFYNRLFWAAYVLKLQAYSSLALMEQFEPQMKADVNSSQTCSSKRSFLYLHWWNSPQVYSNTHISDHAHFLGHYIDLYSFPGHLL